MLKEDFVIQSNIRRMLIRTSLTQSIKKPLSIWVSSMKIRKDGNKRDRSIERFSRSHPTMDTFESVWKESPDEEEEK